MDDDDWDDLSVLERWARMAPQRAIYKALDWLDQADVEDYNEVISEVVGMFAEYRLDELDGDMLVEVAKDYCHENGDGVAQGIRDLANFGGDYDSGDEIAYYDETGEPVTFNEAFEWIVLEAAYEEDGEPMVEGWDDPQRAHAEDFYEDGERISGEDPYEDLDVEDPE